MSSIKTVVDYFHGELKKSRTARQYLKSRGITKDTLIKFRIGYCPRNPDYCNRFHDRIIFPIWDQLGTLVGWTGRTLINDPAKYVNVRESAEYKKARLLYGFNFAKNTIYETGTAILVEGQMDAIILHQVGICNAVASSGTSSFKTAAACLLSRYANKVYIVFDGDEAGQNASLAAAKHLNDIGDITIINVGLPEGEDPASFVLSQGKDKFLELLNESGKNR